MLTSTVTAKKKKSLGTPDPDPNPDGDGSRGAAASNLLILHFWVTQPSSLWCEIPPQRSGTEGSGDE